MVLAAEILVGALLREGRQAHSIPSFGAESRGAPVAAFLRFDDRPIRRKMQVYSPDGLVVTDPRLLKAPDIFQGLKEKSVLVVNSVRYELEEAPPEVSVLGRVDATRIALECLGAPITSTCLLGALAATTGWVGLKAVLAGVDEMLPGMAEGNRRAVERAYAETRIWRRERRE